VNAIVIPIELEPDPIEIDPRPCELCGLTIDRHVEVDNGEGPEFFCADISPDDMTLDELERRAELRRQEEVAAVLARMDAMDRPAEIPPADKPRPYRTAASTVAAFKYVVSLNDADYLARWLANHPADGPELFKSWKGKQC
jgi:hypothetical protein